MSDPIQRSSEIAPLEERLTRLESRLAKLEQQLEALGAQPVGLSEETAPAAAEPITAVDPAEFQRSDEEFEAEVGQKWFAKAGIFALALGAAFALLQPFENQHPALPSLVAYGVTGILFLVAHLWRQSFELLSSYLRGAGMALLYFATLRLYFFGREHVLSTESLWGNLPLIAVVAINLLIALRRRSPYLVWLVLGTGYVTAVAVDSAWFVLVMVVVLAATGVRARLKYEWPGLLPAIMLLTYLTYGIWACNNPFHGREFQLVREPRAAPVAALLCIAILAAGSFLRKTREPEDTVTILSTLLNCLVGYGVFAFHTLVFPQWFVEANIAASLVLLGIAMVFWVREQSQLCTFLYAMTGYLALSAAIIKAVAIPQVFVWLALESLLVVTTAIWFRSRFIIVANFLIYLAVAGAYLILTRKESGIVLTFGVVALITARQLNWKKERLELKTELMRNAYLVCAFFVFPYALYHLVPASYVGLSWVGLALFYYGFSRVMRNRKYRWMGHGTLLSTTLYLVIIGTRQFEPIYRILSFLVLGTVLLAVSLIFNKTRTRGQPSSGASAVTSTEANSKGE